MNADPDLVAWVDRVRAQRAALVDEIDRLQAELRGMDRALAILEGWPDHGVGVAVAPASRAALIPENRRQRTDTGAAPAPSETRNLPALIPSKAAKDIATIVRGRRLARERAVLTFSEPHPPLEAFGREMKTAAQMGDPPFEASALYGRMNDTNGAVERSVARRDPDEAFVERWMENEAAKRNAAREQEEGHVE